MEELFESLKDQIQGLQKIELLKKIESLSKQEFLTNEIFSQDKNILGNDKVKLVSKAILESNFAGVEEYSDDFYKLYDAGVNYQDFLKNFVRYAFKSLDHGFEKFDEILILEILDIMDHYDSFYKEWSVAVRKSEAAIRLISMMAKDSVSLDSMVKENRLDNHYTIITLGGSGEFSQVSYAEYFGKTISRISEGFINLAQKLSEVGDLDTTQKIYIRYFRQYADALDEKDFGKMEERWKALDELWMDIKYHIEIVHDMEFGYGDPLRCKVIPDLSLRFQDETFDKENEKIEEIRKLMVDYYSAKTDDLGKESLKALKNSSAAIYYIPIHTGISYHFRMSGQSIPNRPEVKASKGVKIYFDAESTKIRLEQVKEIVNDLFEDKLLISHLDHIDTIVNHIAAHEFGHVMYPMASMGGSVKSSTISLLEEPRAELTALTFMKEMLDKKMLNKEELIKTFFNFVASDLRRYINFDSEATRPYTISAIATYNKYFEIGYISIQNDKLVVDDSKVLDILEDFKKQYEEILNFQANYEGEELEKVLAKMQTETEITKWLKQKLKINL